MAGNALGAWWPGGGVFPDQHVGNPRTPGHRAPAESGLWSDGRSSPRCLHRAGSEPFNGLSRSVITRWSRDIRTRPVALSTRLIGRHRGHDWKFAVTEGGRHSITITTHWRCSGPRVCLTCTSKPGGPTRSGALRRLHHPCVGDPTRRRRPRAGGIVWDSPGSGCMQSLRSFAFTHPADGRWVEITSPYPADLQSAWMRCVPSHDRGSG